MPPPELWIPEPGQLWLPGAPEPAILAVPRYLSSTGLEAVEICALAGLNLDPWQQIVLAHSLGELKGGKWAAFEVGLAVPRQNGKTLLAVAREIVGLFLLGEKLLIHSAHQFDTSLEAFRLLVELIEGTPEFSRQVKKVSRSHGEEGIELKNGQRIRFRTRTKGGGRGFTADCLILDEAMILAEAVIGALMPTLSARPNPQVWYLGSQVDKEVHEEGIVFARLRERAKTNPGWTKESLAFIEYGLEKAHPSDVTPEEAKDTASAAKANPAYGVRISPQHISREQESMDARTFAVERLGVGDWPDPDEANKRKITPAQWAACTDPDSAPNDPICLSYDVSPDGRSAAISMAGLRSDGQAHGEVIDHRDGTNWVAQRLHDLDEQHNVQEVVGDKVGPGGELIPAIEALGVEVRQLSTNEVAAACGMISSDVAAKTFHHLGTPELASAVAGAISRPLGDRWAWTRVNSHVDITPLVSVSLALWGLRSGEGGTPEVHSIKDAVERLKRQSAERQAAAGTTPPDSVRTEGLGDVDDDEPPEYDTPQGFVSL